jgi:Protein of unknown function (DUF3370)
MYQRWNTVFLGLMAAIIADGSVFPTFANPVARNNTDPLVSLQSVNGYPIARQEWVGSRELLQPQDIRPLPGGLDSIPVFSSNSPEAIRQPGILLSTFPPQGKVDPDAHLNFPLQGRFDVFAHHISKTNKPDTTPTLYNGILLYNPSSTKVITIVVLKAGSFLGNPEAPYIDLPPFLENPLGKIFSGPGGRLTDALLRNNRLPNWPSRIYLPPKSSQMLMNLPTPVPRPGFARMAASRAILHRTTFDRAMVNRTTANRVMPATFPQKNIAQTPILLNAASSSNTRSSIFQLQSDGPIYMAYLAMYAPISPTGVEGVPQKSDWENLVLNGKLVHPRDLPPSSIDSEGNQYYYGRVSGISRGSQWQAKVTDTPRSRRLTIPSTGEAFSYGLNTLPRGTFGTGQIQSALMLSRYADTALMAHGNYGVHYDVSLPLHNPTDNPQQVAVSIQSPIKQSQWAKGLHFLRNPSEQVFFRGTVRVRYKDDSGNPQVRYYHLNQRQGQQGDPLVMVTLPPKEDRLVSVDYIYPPDASPPQVLTIQTLAATPSNQRSAYGIQP